MAILDYFKAVPTMTTDEVRSFLEDHDPGSYNLVDVRQPGEYEDEHLAGATLIPMAELEKRLKELDPNKPTIAY